MSPCAALCLCSWLTAYTPPAASQGPCVHFQPQGCPEGPSPPFPASFTSFIPTPMALNFIGSTSLRLPTRCLAFLPSRCQPCLRTLSAQAPVSLLGWGPWSCTPWLWSHFFLISLSIAFYCVSPISLVFPVQITSLSVCSINICIMNGWLVFINSIHMKWIVWVLLLLGDNSWLMVPGHLCIQYL